ncbi:MAG: DUF1566 domain-containing protein [Lysobacter sp.]|nr:DUF1566 domain-containing protein [Lysobacter sp.]
MNAVAQGIAAPAARFMDNGDGTVTDTRSGLMWSKATMCEEEINQRQAEKLCAGLDLAGHTDWRQPTVDELFALADRTRTEPAIDTEAFPDTRSDWYWTSTITAWSSDSAWIVSFSYGDANDLRRVSGYAFVRAVRGVPAGQ